MFHQIQSVYQLFCDHEPCILLMLFYLKLLLIMQVHGIANVSSNVSVTKLDFCASMMYLAVGTHCGEVRMAFHVVKRSNNLAASMFDFGLTLMLF